MMATGDIWSSGAFAFESPLKDLLDSLDYSLEDLLQEDELLQELRGLHPQLISFFSNEANVAALVQWLVRPPPPSFEVYREMQIQMHMQKRDQEQQLKEAEEKQNEGDLTAAGSAGSSGGDDEKDSCEANSNSHHSPMHSHEHTYKEEKDDLDQHKDHNSNGNDDDDIDGGFESEPEPDISMSELDISRDTLDSDGDRDADAMLSPGQWLLENTSEPVHANNANANADTHEMQDEKSSREDYENRFIRYPYIACEVICCEISNILDIIVQGNVPIEEDEELINDNGHDEQEQDQKQTEKQKRTQQSILDLLFSMVYQTSQFQLDDRRAGYLEKILTMLFRKKRSELTAYINGDHLKAAAATILPTEEESGERTGDGNDTDADDLLVVANHQGGGVELLQVLFQHLHSNSIAQIIQKLLMPKPPSASPSSANGDGDPDSNGNGEIHNSNNFIHHDEDDEEEDDDQMETDEYGGLNCDWADSPVGLDLLLEHLMVPNGSDDSDNQQNEEEQEKVLNASQHACEILTTVIQHSPLNSNVMRIMTGKPILTRLIECACGTPISSSTAPQEFSMHDSTMTTAMNVLEILILQLGGYGTVPTASSPQGEFDEVQEKHNGRSSGTITMSKSGEDGGGKNAPPREAEATTLVRLLPSFLSSLCNLLKHPVTDEWKLQFQYSKKPQLMLGASRLRIVRLLESLVLLSIRDVDLILCTSECLEICLDLFWDFPWCSMLHQSVANLLVHILEGGDERIDLQLYFLNRCNLPKRLMDSFDSPLFTSTLEDVAEVEPAIAHSNATSGEYSTVLAMKSYRAESESSSLDVEQGSDESGSSGGDEPIQTSNNEQDIEGATRTELEEEKEGGHKNTVAQNGEVSQKLVSTAARKEITFRMGYMGHVIIICQALVHACGAIEQSSDANENQSDAKDTQESEHGSEARPAAARNMILTLLRANRHYKAWNNFVTTTLASETAVQSTPLGGYNAQEELNAAEQHTESTLEDSFGGQFDDDGDIGESSGFGAFDVGNGDIDLNDVDVDIAASVMESMNITPSGDTLTPSDGSGNSKGHNRQRGVITGQGIGNGTAFGTVVEMHQKPDEYVYDDPLGGRHHFDDELNNDSDGESNGESGESDNADGDDEAPVMDLFAGNFDFESTNIESGENDDAEGWANFDDGDFSSEIVAGDSSKQSASTFASEDDPFGSSDVFGFVADSANIISSLEKIEDENDSGSGDLKSKNQASDVDNEEQ